MFSKAAMAKAAVAVAVVLAAACSPAQVPRNASSRADADAAATASVLSTPSRGALPVCTAGQLLGYAPDEADVAQHRQSALPVIHYSYDTKLQEPWEFGLTLRVDANGRVVCYRIEDRFGQKQPLTAQRRLEIDNLRHWRYAPFAKDGIPVAAIVKETIAEEELPARHIPLPQVPLDSVRIVLERSGCFGTCPSYRIEINGDGRVIYNGQRYVDVQGEHAYRIPPSDVAKLVESLKAKDLWSLRPSYEASMTDNPTYALRIRMGGEEHGILDYVGGYVGMPRAVSNFEQEGDRIAKSSMWLNLSPETIARLAAESFRFDSPAGAELLARALANRHPHNDEALLQLIELGAPLDAADTLLPQAIERGDVALVEPLIANGALRNRGKTSQAKVDAAFRAAIASGQLAMVQRIWAIAADQPHPSLTFEEPGAEGHARSSVALLLSRPFSRNEPWGGMEIAQWLAQQGADLKATAANGNTLLHIAVDAGDAAFVRYLLQLGLDPSAQGAYGLPPLASARDEDIALLLLEAGGDPTAKGRKSDEFARYAQDNGWERVVRWLRLHSK